MGFAVAAAAREAGAHVTMITGPVQLPTPAGITRINVESARDMYGRRAPPKWRNRRVHCGGGGRRFSAGDRGQAKDQEAGLAVKLDLEPAPDIVKSVADMAKRPFVVGFAAETNDVEENARSKLKRKKLDMIAPTKSAKGSPSIATTTRSPHMARRQG